MLATLESVMHVFQERIFEPSSCAWLRARLPGLNPAPDPIRLLAANSQIRNPIRLLASNPIGNPIGNIYIHVYIYIGGLPPTPSPWRGCWRWICCFRENDFPEFVRPIFVCFEDFTLYLFIFGQLPSQLCITPPI